MKVLEGKDVDVIMPFPSSALAAVIGWMHCYKSFIIGDDGPPSDEQLIQHIYQLLSNPNIVTMGVVDKYNLTKSEQIDIPLVGLFYFEPIAPNNGYVHVTSNRRAWGNRVAQPGLMEQAAHLCIADVFATVPTLTRLSSSIVSTNKAAINFAKKLGFNQDGLFRQAVIQNSKPKDVVHLGLLKEEYGSNNSAYPIDRLQHVAGV